MTLETDHLDTNLWSNFLDQLSRTTQLRQFEIYDSRYGFLKDNSEEFLEENFFFFKNRSFIVLPTGRFRLHEYISGGSRGNFFLMFSEGRASSVVLADQMSICVQLKALADQVAQMETNKIAEITSERFVSNDVVGIKQDFNDRFDPMFNPMVNGEWDHDDFRSHYWE
ncbi:hypothetical protein KCU78_g9672, partial [Aureobasidium melanogenum]